MWSEAWDKSCSQLKNYGGPLTFPGIMWRKRWLNCRKSSTFAISWFLIVFYVSPASHSNWGCLPVASPCCVRPRSNDGNNENINRSEKTQRKSTRAKWKRRTQLYIRSLLRVVYPLTDFTRTPGDHFIIIEHLSSQLITKPRGRRHIPTSKRADVMWCHSGQKHLPVFLWPSNLQQLPPSSVPNAMWPVESPSAQQSH